MESAVRPQHAAGVEELWKALLERDPAEREVQRFFEQNPSFLVGEQPAAPAGGLVFTQPRLQGLGSRQFPDFLWLDTSGGTLTPVLVEIERLGKTWFTKRGDLTAQFHQAHQQLGDWRAWFLEAENQLLFRRAYVDWLGNFRSYPLVPRYVLVYGRGVEFDNDETGRRSGRRFVTARSHETLSTYDQLTLRTGVAGLCTVHLDTLDRLRVRALEPTFTVEGASEVLLRRADTPVSAIRAVPGWSEEKRAKLLLEWRRNAASLRQQGVS